MSGVSEYSNQALERPYPSGVEDDVVGVAEALLGRAEALASASVERVFECEPSYRDGVAPAELRDSTMRNIRLILLQVAGLPLMPELRDAPERAGRTRASQQVPLEAVLRSFRIDFRVVWEAMLDDLGQMAAPDRFESFTSLATKVWEAIDSISLRVSVAYRERESELRKHEDEQIQVLIDVLIRGVGPVTTVARKAAAELGLTDLGYFAVVCAETIGGPALREPSRALAAAGMRSVWRLEPERQIGVVEVGTRGPDAVASALRPVTQGRVGISPTFHGLHHTRDNVSLAEAALHALRSGTVGVALLDDNLLNTILAASPELSLRMYRQVLGPLDDLRKGEKERVMETICAYLDNSGSIGRTAAAMFCHRNTVLNHIKRFEEITGRSLRHPRQLAEILAAVEVARIIDKDPAA